MNAYIEEQLRRVALMISQEEFGDALAELRQLEAYLADDGRAWQLRGFAHFGLGEFAKATSAFETASLLVPLGTSAQIRLAQLYLRRRRREAAQAIYLHLATCELLPEAEVELVVGGLAGVGAFDDSLRFCLAQLERFAGNHRLQFAAAGAMRRLGHGGDEVLGFLRRAHQLQPHNVGYRIALARCLLTENRRAEAARILDGVDLEATQCIPSLESMRMLFQRLNVVERVEHCRTRLEAIALKVSSGYRPSKHEF